jgi:hypothetical protein
MSVDATSAAAHAALAAHVQAQGLDLRYSLRRTDRIDAAFRTREQGGPSIEVYRKDLATADDVWREIALIAHEFGHATSERLGLRSDAYRLASDHVAHGYLHFSHEEVLLVLREEALAWAFAALVLEQLGIDVPGFEEMKRDNLCAYCRFMGMREEVAEMVDDFVASQLAR